MVISIKILSNADKNKFPDFFDQMYRGRAVVFYERLGWDVQVKDGCEIDHYDEHDDPVYLLAVGDHNRVLGSLRLLATTGATMLQSEFKNFFDGDADVSGPTIWECTRFCVSPGGTDSVQRVNQVSTKLLIGLCDLCLSSGIEFIVGVYNVTMVRIYKRIGWSPEPLAKARPQFGDISVGLWEATPAVLSEMKNRNLSRLQTQTKLMA